MEGCPRARHQKLSCFALHYYATPAVSNLTLGAFDFSSLITLLFSLKEVAYPRRLSFLETQLFARVQVAALGPLLGSGAGEPAGFLGQPSREAGAGGRHLLDAKREELLERERGLLSEILALLRVRPLPNPPPL